MKIVIVNGIKTEITKDTITKTCRWYADNCQGCINEVLSGEVRVNDQDSYISDKLKQKEKWLAEIDYDTLAFWQKAVYIQTGECVGLLG